MITSLKIPSYKVSNKPDMARLLIGVICLLKKIRLSDTQEMVLAHFMTEGYNTVSKEQVVEAKLLKTQASLNNTLMAFRNHGILVRENFKEVLSPDFRFPIAEKININITLDNT